MHYNYSSTLFYRVTKVHTHWSPLRVTITPGSYKSEMIHLWMPGLLAVAIPDLVHSDYRTLPSSFVVRGSIYNFATWGRARTQEVQ